MLIDPQLLTQSTCSEWLLVAPLIANLYLHYFGLATGPQGHDVTLLSIHLQLVHTPTQCLMVLRHMDKATASFLVDYLSFLSGALWAVFWRLYHVHRVTQRQAIRLEVWTLHLFFYFFFNIPQ